MRKTVVVACENLTLMARLSEILEQDYSIETATASTVLNVAHRNPPVLIIIAGPNPETGEEALALVRADPMTVNIPVIACYQGEAASVPSALSVSDISHHSSDLDMVMACISALLEQRGIKEIVLKASNVAKGDKQSVPYKLLFDNMLSGVTFCKMIYEGDEPRDFLYIDINPAFEKMSGLSNVLGKTISEVIPGVFEIDHHLLEIHAEVVRTGKPARFENYVESMQKWFSASVYRPFPEHFVCIFDDITAQKLAMQRLAFQAELLNDISDAIIFTDLSHRISYWNRAAESTYGWKSEEVIGRDVHEILSTEVLDSSVEEASERIKVTGTTNWEGSQQCRDGSKVSVESTCIAMRDTNGELIGFAAAHRNVTERINSQRLIEHLAYFDMLTDLPNRSLFLDRLSQAMMFSHRTGNHGAVIFIDLDQFKKVNDVYGHGIGDLILTQASSRLLSGLRASDTVARFGGDEFMILLPELNKDPRSAAAMAMSIAEKLRLALEMPYDAGPYNCTTSASMGVSLFPREGLSEQDLVREADIAMYRAKHHGRNAIVFFEEQMQTAINAKYALEQDLRQAVEDNQLILYFQSQFTRNQKVSGAEALVRWKHPTQGLIQPGAFIPLAEELGIISLIGEWVLRETCRTLALLGDAAACLRLSVNVSPHQFHQPGFTQLVSAILSETGADPTRLTLEVTENLFFDRTDKVLARMKELAGMGFEFSIDDFGTGFSSMAYLKSLPLSELKIDKSFVQGIPQDQDDLALVGSVMAIARHFSLRVVAEGVENEIQFNTLADRDCETYQGFLFSKPQPVDEWLAQFRASLPASGT